MGSPADSAPAPGNRAQSRREGPRLEVEELIGGELSRGSVPLVLNDLGFGGFAVASVRMFVPGTRHGFRFRTVDGVAVLLRADVVYCRPADEDDRRYVAGFRYVIGGPGDQRTVDLLIDTVNSPLEFP